jgi:hypothetical protein
VSGLYPSLYLNLGECYRKLGDLANARNTSGVARPLSRRSVMTRTHGWSKPAVWPSGCTALIRRRVRDVRRPVEGPFDGHPPLLLVDSRVPVDSFKARLR